MALELEQELKEKSRRAMEALIRLSTAHSRNRSYQRRTTSTP